MGAGQYLVSLVLSALALGPVAAGALSLRARLLPGWTGAPARLAEAVVFLALVWAAAMLLGAVGALGRASFVVVSLLVGAVAFAAGRSGRPDEVGDGAPPAPASDRLGVVVAGAAVALVLAQWGVRVLDMLDHGMEGSDTLSYHGPVAARFLQDGSITSLEFVYSDPIIPFLPFGSELLHTVGMLLFDSDGLSPFLNLGWLALAFLAAWCMGRPFGVAPLSLLGVSIVLASPALVTTQAGLDGNDIVAVALVLSAAALLLNAGWRPGAVGLAGLAAGLALGAKVTAIAPVAALTLGVVAVAPAGRRAALGATWLVPMLAAGSFWYLRNLFRVGNPLPAVELDVGPLSLASPPLPQTYTVAHYLGDAKVWDEFLRPGLNTALGEAWWLVLALAALAMVAGVVAGRGMPRVLAVAAIASVLVYLVTPRGADGPEGVPFFFMFTIRYVTPGLALALAILPLVPPLAGVARRPWLYGALGALLVVTLLDSGIRTGDLRRVTIALALGGLFALAARAAATRPPRNVVVGGLVVGAAIVLGAGFVAQRDYLRERYREGPLAFARDLADQRIAVVGQVRAYPLFGAELSNRVDQVARLGPHGAFLRIRGCRAWREALAAGRYRYVVTSPPLLPYTVEGLLFGPSHDPKGTPEASWTRSDPSATELTRSGKVTVFRIDGSPDPATCGSR